MSLDVNCQTPVAYQDHSDGGGM